MWSLLYKESMTLEAVDDETGVPVGQQPIKGVKKDS